VRGIEMAKEKTNMKRIVAVPLEDVSGIEVKCKCGTAWIFPSSEPGEKKQDIREILKYCPICGESMGDAYLAAYVIAASLKDALSFRVTFDF
jgi:hypothetical protein